MKKILNIVAISLLALSFGFCSSSKPKKKVTEEDVDKAVDMYDKYKDRKKPTKEDIYSIRERDFK